MINAKQEFLSIPDIKDRYDGAYIKYHYCTKDMQRHKKESAFSSAQFDLLLDFLDFNYSNSDFAYINALSLEGFVLVKDGSWYTREITLYQESWSHRVRPTLNLYSMPF